MKNTLLVYTRRPLDTSIYSANLAFSMHIALDNGQGFIPLNHNFGILFARAVENESGMLESMSLDSPCVFRTHGGGFGVLAVRVRTENNGAVPDERSRGAVLVFTSKDLVRYEEIGLLRLSDSTITDVFCLTSEDGYTIYFRDARGTHKTHSCDLLSTDAPEMPAEMPEIAVPEHKIEGALPRHTLALTDEEADYIYKKLTTPENTRVTLPENITVRSRDELYSVRATAHYSDSTTAQKRIDWYDDAVDYSRPGKYTVRGRVHQDRYEFPISRDRADPCIGKWEGHYYFIATNDRDGNNSLSIRRADSIPALATSQEVEILNTRTYPHMTGLLWAPEFHEVGGRLCIFHAATENGFPNEQSHVMMLKEHGNPIVADDWEPSRRIVRADGSPLFTLGITLDMTVFREGGRTFAVWSQRRYDPADYGAWLYIAELSESEPWRLLSEPVVLSRPDYGWANNHTFVDEGPYALITDDMIYLTFSSSAVDSTYVIGMLSAPHGADMLDPSAWTKCGFPILTSLSVPGQFGCGHNSYVTDEYGDIWNVYHGRPGVHAPRCAGIRRVHFDVDGAPRLDLTEDRDLSPAFADVKAVVTVI